MPGVPLEFRGQEGRSRFLFVLNSGFYPNSELSFPSCIRKSHFQFRSVKENRVLLRVSAETGFVALRLTVTVVDCNWAMQVPYRRIPSALARPPFTLSRHP